MTTGIEYATNLTQLLNKSSPLPWKITTASGDFRVVSVDGYGNILGFVANCGETKIGQTQKPMRS
jgi:hypothetical protein